MIDSELIILGGKIFYYRPVECLGWYQPGAPGMYQPVKCPGWYGRKKKVLISLYTLTSVFPTCWGKEKLGLGGGFHASLLS